MTFPTEPTQPLPTWATGVGALKVDPGATKRALGWTRNLANKGEIPIMQWVNNESYNNGQWMTYCRSALLYIKSGNFDTGITIASGGLTVTAGGITVNAGNIAAAVSLIDAYQLRAGALYLRNSAGNHNIQLFPPASLSSSVNFQLPGDYPAGNNYSLVSDTSGVFSFIHIPPFNGLTVAQNVGGAVTLDDGAEHVLNTISVTGSAAYLVNVAGGVQFSGGGTVQIALSTNTGFSGAVSTTYCASTVGSEIPFSLTRQFTPGVSTIYVVAQLISAGSATASSTTTALQLNGY